MTRTAPARDSARRVAAVLLALLGCALAGVLLACPAAAAPTAPTAPTPPAVPAVDGGVDISVGDGTPSTSITLILAVTVLSVAPSVLLLTTSFTKIAIVLSLTRTALGLQQSPPNAVIVSLSLFLSAIVMAPTFQASYEQGIRPLLDQQMELPQAFGEASAPVKRFMLTQVDQDDLALFVRLSETPRPRTQAELPLQVVTPAFMISELKRAFEIGFLLFVPFLVIDLVVASVLMSMGMMMLPPVVVSLPFKLIFFVLVDGWYLVSGSLVRSFG